VFPYWLLFSVCAAGALQYRSRGAAREGGPLLVALAAAIALMIGLRYRVGGDWGAYIEILNESSYLSLGEALSASDPGYVVLNWVMYQLGLGIAGVNLVCGAIFIWGLTRFARLQPNPWLALLIAVPYLVIVVGMGYTRQAVAIGLIMAGLASIEGRRILRFSLYVAAAALFHKTAVVVLPLVALATVRQHLLGAVILAVLFVVLYLGFVDEAADRMITNYVESGYESEGAGIRVAMNIPPALLFLLMRKRFNLSLTEQLIWRNYALAAFASVGLLVALNATAAVDRLALYLIPLQILVLARLPNLFSKDGRPNSQMILLLIIYAAGIQFTWLNYAVHAEFWLPYQLFGLAET
jgi:hypothetical protein